MLRLVKARPVAAVSYAWAGRSAWLDEAGFVGRDDELRAVAGAELGQQAANVGLGGSHGDVQGLGDLVVGQAAADQGEYFAFPVGDPVQGCRRLLAGLGAAGELGDKP